jgi:HEAT repeat protein
MTLGACSKQQPDFSPQQKERSEILEDFDADESRSIDKYRAIWLEEKDDPRKQVQMTTIAGELVAVDPAHFDAYFAFIQERLSAESLEARAAAVGALGKARGRKAIDLLVVASRSSDTYIAQAAMRALNYRLATAYYDPESIDDRRYLEQQLPRLCSQPHSAEIGQFCMGNG